MMLSWNNGLYIILSFWLASSNQAIELNEPQINPLITVTIPNQLCYKTCAPEIYCDQNAKYRSINGSCNNLCESQWGSSNTSYARMGPAAYSDNDHKIRKQSNGDPLPETRELQLKLFLYRSQDLPDIRNVHVVQFGQWLAHDTTLTIFDFIDCCAIQNSGNVPDNCDAIIKIAPDDPLYKSKGKTCMNFIRATTSNSPLYCPVSPKVIRNQATGYIDVSHLYGTTKDVSDSLRTFTGGKLKTTTINGQEFCVEKPKNGSLVCDGRKNVNTCFDGGDPRLNQNFGVIIYQQVFVRFHNYLTDILYDINKSWTDEKLYEEARRILGAVSMITAYKHYLPMMLGKEYCDTVGLTLCKTKRTVYNPTLLSQSTVEFAAGGFRIPHNQIPQSYYFLDDDDSILDTKYLHSTMSFPDPLTKGCKFEELLRGISNLCGRYPTKSYNYGISNYMQWVPDFTFQDLLSVDITRCRDLGCLTYAQTREVCGLSKVTSFDDLNGIFTDDIIEILQSLYYDVNDIDLIVGCLLEQNVPDGMVGETARCIIADGFYRLRYADEFFVDIPNRRGSFTDDQYDFLWNLNLTTIFCLMTRIDKLPCDIFMPKGSSEMCDCSAIQDLNLEAWYDPSC